MLVQFRILYISSPGVEALYISYVYNYTTIFERNN